MSSIKQINEEPDKILNEDFEQEKIQIAEGGLSRIYTHIKDDNRTFGMISAYRHENTPEENNKQTSLLTSDLAHAHLGAIKMEGGYLETQKDDTFVPVIERSFFVPNMTLEQAKELCAKYNQDSVLFKDKDGMRYIDRNGNTLETFSGDIIVDDNFELHNIKDYFSRRLQGGNQRNYFTFKETFYVGIQNWNWGRHTVKEYDNLEKSDRYTNINQLID